MSESKQQYIERVRKATENAQKAKMQNPQLDFSDLLHSFLNLDLDITERLARSLRRSGHIRS